MTTVKVTEEVRKSLTELKRLLGVKTYNDVLSLLSESELGKYCYTRDGYADTGTVISIEGTPYTIVDIVDNTVIAKEVDGVEVTEFYKRGKVAWWARIV